MGKQVKLLFVNSPQHYSHGHHFTQISWPNYTLPYLTAICGGNHEYHIHDHATAMESLATAVKRFKPDIIGFSIIASRDLYNTIKLIKKIKGCGASLIAGGQGASAHGCELHKEGVWVIAGEGEEVLREVADADPRNWPVNERWGTCVRTREKFWIDLDDAPFPRWDLMPLVRSRVFKDRYTGAIEMSRGCKQGCDYCAVSSYWKNTYRRKSNEKIIDELKRLVAMGRSHIYLADDNFGGHVVQDMADTLNLFDDILEQGIDIKLFAQTRPQTIVRFPIFAEVGAKAGLYGVLVGYHNEEINELSSAICRQNGIGVFESNIYGLPEQKTVSDYWPLFQNTRRNADIARFPMFSLLPGSFIGKKMITANALEQKEGSDDFRLPMRSKGANRTFQHGILVVNLLHIFLDIPKLAWYNLFRSKDDIQRKFICKDYMGAIRYWIGRFKAWTQ